jgi:carbon storage regulator
MLVLSRKVGETICIGDDIKVSIVAIERDKVRLGFEAPKSVPVHRQEVYDAIHNKGGVDAKDPKTATAPDKPPDK